MSEPAVLATTRPPGPLAASPRRGADVTRRRPWTALEVLALVYLFVTPLELVRLPGGTPAFYAGLVFIAFWILELLRGQVGLPHHRWVVGAAAAFVLWNATTTLWSIAPGASLVRARTLALLLLSAIALASVFAGRVRRPAWALLLGSTLAAFLAMRSGVEVVVRAGRYIETEQYTIAGVDQNALSFHLLVGAAAGLYLMSIRGSKGSRWLIAGALVTIVAATILVGSRTALGTLILLAPVYLVLTRRSRKAFAAGIALVGAAVATYLLIGNSGRLPSRLSEWLANPEFFDVRFDFIALYRQTMSEWMWFGVGAGGDAEYLWTTSGVFKSAHNAFWKVWIETGVVGLILFTAFVVGTAIIGYRSKHRAFFILATVPIAAFFYSLGPVSSNMLWAIFGLALGTPVVKEALTNRRPPPVIP